jgi:hypothetical protein
VGTPIVSTSKEMLKRILLGVAFSWVMSVTLGIFYSIVSFGIDGLRLSVLLLMTVSISSLIALLFSPLAAWATRTGSRNLFMYAPVLWAVLAVHIFVGVKHWFHLTQASLFALGVVGTVAIGCIPRRV